MPPSTHTRDDDGTTMGLREQNSLSWIDLKSCYDYCALFDARLRYGYFTLQEYDNGQINTVLLKTCKRYGTFTLAIADYTCCRKTAMTRQLGLSSSWAALGFQPGVVLRNSEVRHQED